jgi:Beta propeller domain
MQVCDHCCTTEYSVCLHEPIGIDRCFVAPCSDCAPFPHSPSAIAFIAHIAVTFRQTDPFYVLDLNPARAKVLGELEISGFSSYIQSINADDTLLITVGQEADTDGRVTGVKISLFDASNAAKPKELQKFVAEEDPDVYSSSSVQWDFKAFRWLSLGDGVGILIMPLQIYSNNGSLKGNFDGFKVYDVSANGISERVTISHVASNQFYSCYYEAYLPERSFVFDGNVTTMKGHSVVSTDLDTGLKRWTLDMPKPVDKDDCVNWLF